jgi:PAS domain-containing protein
MSAKSSGPDARAYPVSAAQQLQAHLKQYPQDLIDIRRRLMGRYRLSAREVQRVLNSLTDEEARQPLLATEVYAMPRHTRTRWLCPQIVEGTQEAIIFADRDGLIRLWNAGAEEFAKLSGAPPLKMLLSDLHYG